jgi:hypothetical protein
VRCRTASAAGYWFATAGEVDAAGTLESPLVGPVGVLVGEGDAAAAPAGPPVARAPAIMVAPSSLEMRIGSDLLGFDGSDVIHHRGAPG